ncbi:DUF7532 family protein [Haloarchaeobius sp. DFWS5]|uniref:DUF7532 family protein n=1 Tax=Haloarchaeobius sp. DFWS5 TaxID=3446114 RepID=UPI003EBEE1BF
MHFDQRTQAALRAVGLSTDDLQTASADVAERTAADADALMEFFETNDVVYSDMDMAHSANEFPEHTVEYCDITTHAAEMRGWLRFDTWGVFVEDGRTLDDGTVELTLGPSVHDRVRFAPTRDKL